jgi:hypothetical protein
MVTADYLRMTTVIPSNNREISLKFKYSLDSPSIENNHLDPTKLAFSFKGDEEDIEQIK